MIFVRERLCVRSLVATEHRSTGAQVIYARRGGSVRARAAKHAAKQGGDRRPDAARARHHQQDETAKALI